MRPVLTTFTLIAVILLSPDLHSQSGPPAVGIVAQIGGEVFLERGKTRTAARLADLLYPEDRIVATTGHANILFCPSSERMTIAGGTTVEFGADRLKVLKGGAPLRTPARCLLPRIALGSESLERMGGLKARGGPPVPLYIGGTLSSRRPEFCWGPVKDTELYRLTLRDTKTNLQVWEHSTTSTCDRYPAAQSPLGSSEYQWEVSAEAQGTTLAKGTAVFEVKPGADPVQSGDIGPEDSLMRAIDLENRGYYSEAAAYYRAEREANPSDKRLTQHLAWLYWNSGLITAANEEFKRLAAGSDK